MLFGEKIETRKCQSCDHFISHIAHQIDRQSHNSGILHELCMSMDGWVWGKKVNPVKCYSGKKLKTRKCQSCDHFMSHIAHQIDRQSHNSGILHELCMLMDGWVWEKRVNPVKCYSGKKLKTRKCQSCDHFIFHIAHQIDRQSHNSGILHELCMSMDVWVWEKRVNPVNIKFCLQTLWSSYCTSDW